MTLVFDGASPPGKGGTTTSRSEERAQARQRCVDMLSQKVPLDNRELQRAAVNAVAFTSNIVARVARVVGRLLHCECITSPYEADAQLFVLEDLYLSMGKRVLVRATDSDLIVVGVRSLLWNVETDGRGLIGDVITREGITHPQINALRTGVSDGMKFVRLLHGVGDGASLGDEIWWLSQEDGVMERLLLWASVSGNDYSNFPRVGPAKATDICLRKKDGEFPTLEHVVGSLVACTSMGEGDVRACLERSRNMTRTPVVYIAVVHRQVTSLLAQVCERP